jgi:hypothetical protein
MLLHVILSPYWKSSSWITGFFLNYNLSHALKAKAVVSATDQIEESDPVYKENRVQKPYKLYTDRFIRETRPKNHTCEETYRPHNAAPRAQQTHTTISGAAAPT